MWRHWQALRTHWCSRSWEEDEQLDSQNGWKSNLAFGRQHKIRPSPHFAGEIWKRSFISPVRLSVHTNPEKLSTENGALRKRSWKLRNLKTELCVLVWTENILKTKLFENDDVTIIRWFVCPSLPQTQIQNNGRNGDCHVDFATWFQLKPCYEHAHGCTQAFLPPAIVLWRSVDGKHFIRFLVWTKNIWCVFKVNPPFSSHVNSHLLNWHYLHLRPELLTWRFHWSEMF